MELSCSTFYHTARTLLLSHVFKCPLLFSALEETAMLALSSSTDEKL